MVGLAARLPAPVDSWGAGMRLALLERARLEEHLRLRPVQTMHVDRAVHTLHKLHSLVVT